MFHAHQRISNRMTPAFRQGGGGDSDRPAFDKMQLLAVRSRCPGYSQYFQENSTEIANCCRNRNPHDYRVDGQGRRWERGQVAQTQILQENDSRATLQVGSNKLTINRADKSVRIQNADGTEQTVDLKVFEDPHISSQGVDLGTIKENLGINLKDGSQVRFLMGDGNGHAAKPGEPSFVDSVAMRSPDGTGALVTGVSGPGKLELTPLDSSHASEFLAQKALNKFGHYEANEVTLDGKGNLIDQSNGQIIHDQAGLNRLDNQDHRDSTANHLVGQGYLPQSLADQYDRPLHQYDDGMRRHCQRDLSRMLQQLHYYQSMFRNSGDMSLTMARHATPGGMAYLPAHPIGM